jgi:phytoene dehydrogenase-like protein
MARTADALVIGAGHNGLVCAGYLARAGLDVLVVERSHRIGGACVTEELHPGFRFSTFAYGAHGPGEKICRDLEIPAQAFRIETTDPTTFHPFPDGDHILLWRDVERTAAGLDRFGPRESEGYLAYQKFLDAAVSIASDWFLGPPPTQVELVRKYAGTDRAPVLETILTRSHWDVLGDYFDSDKVKCATARADDAGDPTAVGALVGEVLESASTGAGVENRAGIVHGGMGMITCALADAASRFGAEIRTTAAVEEIVVEAGRAMGVRLDSGEELRARIVVSNADPKRTFLKLLRPENIAPEFRKQVENIKTRAGYMKYHAALSGLPRYSALPAEYRNDPKAIAHARLAPSLDVYRRAWSDAQSGIPAREPILSVQVPTVYTPDMAPAGKHILGIWVRYAPARPRDGRDWDELRDSTQEIVVDLVERYAPGFRDLVEWQRLYTPLDIERETGITDATIRHVDMTLDQLLSRRPLPAWSTYRTPVDGLWLCGSGTHPCGSVTGGPGHNAAHAILDDPGP